MHIQNKMIARTQLDIVEKYHNLGTGAMICGGCVIRITLNIHNIYKEYSCIVYEACTVNTACIL